MGGLASYYRSEADYCDVFAAVGQFPAGLRYFTGARHPYNDYLLICGAMTTETIYRTGQQL
jgi:hypothetical protein